MTLIFVNHFSNCEATFADFVEKTCNKEKHVQHLSILSGTTLTQVDTGREKRGVGEKNPPLDVFDKV